MSDFLQERDLPEWELNPKFLKNLEYQVLYGEIIRMLSAIGGLRTSYIRAVLDKDDDLMSRMQLASNATYSILVPRIEKLKSIARILEQESEKKPSTEGTNSI